MRVADRHDAVVGREVLQHVGAVRHEVAGPGEGVAEAGERGPVERRARLVGHQLGEVGGRLGEPDHHRERIGRRHPDGVHRHRPAVDRLGVQDRRQHAGVFRPRRRVEHAAEAVHDVVGDDRIAVRPAPVGAQREGPGQAVGGGGPARGRPRHQGAVGAVGAQALVEVEEDRRLGHGRGLVRVEGLGVGAVAAPVGGGTGRAGGDRRDEGRGAQGRGTEAREDVPAPHRRAQAPVWAWRPAASIPASAAFSSLSEVSPEMPTAPRSTPSRLISTPPGTGISPAGPATWVTAATK